MLCSVVVGTLGRWIEAVSVCVESRRLVKFLKERKWNAANRNRQLRERYWLSPSVPSLSLQTGSGQVCDVDMLVHIQTSGRPDDLPT